MLSAAVLPWLKATSQCSIRIGRPCSGESYSHEGEEFIYVLRGDLAITVAESEYQLKPGDSFYFESATPHHWKNPGRRETVVLWVNTPPTF